MHVPALVSVALVLASCAGSPRRAPDPGPWPLVYAEDFATPGDLAGYTFSDPASWQWSDVHGRPSLTLRGGSRYEPRFRSPASIALVPDLEVADFDLEVDLLQTGRDYAHRDLCLFFGWQSPTRFYYVHLATTPDANAHNVFRVADAPRTNLAPVAAQGVDWGTDWHHVRLERRAAAGTIRLFWDRSAEPILTAECTAFDWGRIGFGSFDDSGCMTSLRVWAPATRSAREARPFAPTDVSPRSAPAPDAP